MAEAEPAVMGARARVRAELTREILDVARRHLAEHGAAALSLRAVARDVGMVSSAVYRYYPSRDDLLTALIISSYDDLGATVEAAERAVARRDLHGRWMAICHATRQWALAKPHEYALLYGTPVPGYRAPQDTIAPATRVPTLMVGLLVDGLHEGKLGELDKQRIARAVRADLMAIKSEVDIDLPDEHLLRGLMAWTHLFGSISFELFGHRHNVTFDNDAFFAAEMERIGRFVGIVP